MELVIEVFFVDASKPLHRLLLSTFKKLPCFSLIGSLIVNRIIHEVNRYEASRKDSFWNNAVVLSAPITSFLWIPQFQEWIEPCSSNVVRVISLNISDVLKRADEGEPAAPSTMQQVQDGISALYYLIQQHGANMTGDSLSLALRSMFCALQGKSLVREAMASAASTMWVCLNHSPSPLATLAQGLFMEEDDKMRITDSLEGIASPVRIEFVKEIRSFSAVGKCCALKGLTTAVGLPLLCSRLWVQHSEEVLPLTPFSFILDGILSYSCQLVLLEAGGDAHLKVSP